MKTALGMLSILSLLASCGGGGGADSSALSASIDPNQITGVAATGAPVSQGDVVVKGRLGATVQTRTNNNGSYSIGISSLESPYLVRIIAPSGQTLISVADAAALALGKKINVTPLSHIIVANVFQNGNIETLFNNFETESAEYTPEKLEDEKEKLTDKFIAAGLIGSGGVVDSNVDLLNGVIQAGTSNGIDGLLDVIEVNTDATAEIEVTLKGGDTPFITDKLDGTDDVAATPLGVDALASASTSLTILEKARTGIELLGNTLSQMSYCNGDPVDNGTACDIDNLYTLALANFHSDYYNGGKNEEVDAWDWICADNTNYNYIGTRDDCLTSEIDLPEDLKLTDVTLISYDDTSKIAVISFNVYISGTLRETDIMRMKLDSSTGTYKMVGNGSEYELDLESESTFSTNYNTSTNVKTDVYKTIIDLWTRDGTFTSGDEGATVKLLSDIFPGNEKQLYVVAAYADPDTSTVQYKLTANATPYTKWTWDDTSNTFVETNHSYNYCSGSDGMTTATELENCTAYFQWNNQDLELTAEEVGKMGRTEIMTLQITDSSDTHVFINKPLIINATNASTYVPSVNMSTEDFCALNYTSLDLSAPTGSLSHMSFSFAHHDADGSNWNFLDFSQDLDDYGQSTNYDFSSDIPAGKTLANSNMYLSSNGDYGSNFVRRINCQN